MLVATSKTSSILAPFSEENNWILRTAELHHEVYEKSVHQMTAEGIFEDFNIGTDLAVPLPQWLGL